MTRIDIAVKIAEIPPHWEPPRYSYGQVIVYNKKFCEIVGRRYISPFSPAGKADPDIVGWHYLFYETPDTLDPIEIPEAEVITR
ncbi:MAG: hypothetical protein Fur006_42250 [Coleofasciculaceae cyanobacterium]|jgi:hypothetical protein